METEWRRESLQSLANWQNMQIAWNHAGAIRRSWVLNNRIVTAPIAAREPSHNGTTTSPPSTMISRGGRRLGGTGRGPGHASTPGYNDPPVPDRRTHCAYDASVSNTSSQRPRCSMRIIGQLWKALQKTPVLAMHQSCVRTDLSTGRHQARDKIPSGLSDLAAACRPGYLPRCLSKNSAISPNATTVSGRRSSNRYCACDWPS